MTAEPTTHEQPAPVKPRRRGKIFILIGLLATLVWFAPSIIANTSLRQQLLPALAPQYPAPIEVGSASLSWTSPVVLRDVTFQDTDQQPFMQVQEISTGETLLQLLLNSAGVHPITINAAVVNVRFREEGSNLEDVIAPFADPTSTYWPGVALEIEESTLNVAEEQGGAAAMFEQLHVSVHKTHRQNIPYQISMSASSRGGAVRSELTWTPPAELTSPAAGSGELNVQTDQFPLEALRPIFARASLREYVIARLTSDLKTSWNTAGQAADYQIAGELQTGPLKSPRQVYRIRNDCGRSICDSL